MTINFASAPSNISINEKIRIAGEFVAGDAVPASHINGREFTVNNVSGNSITIIPLVFLFLTIASHSLKQISSC